MSFGLGYYESGSVRTLDAFSENCGLCSLREIKTAKSSHTSIYINIRNRVTDLFPCMGGLECVGLRHISGYLDVNCCTVTWKLYSTDS
jgi:hypothetical protein